MGALETNTTLIYGVHVRESANDGSDFTNAAADYRIFFVGEDGLLHLKDSSGTVTTPAQGGAPAGAVTSSGLTMATARMLGRTTASTGAIEEITVGAGLSLSAGSLTATGGSGTNLNPGTSFPGGPSTNDLCFRTDRGLLYFYNGTRWLTLDLYRGVPSLLVGSNTTTPQNAARWTAWHTTYDLWLETFYTMAYVATTNTGSAYWTMTLRKYQNDFSTSSSIVAPTTAAQAANVAVTTATSIGALLTPATYVVVQAELTKTGSPGAINYAGEISYRLVG